MSELTCAHHNSFHYIEKSLFLKEKNTGITKGFFMDKGNQREFFFFFRRLICMYSVKKLNMVKKKLSQREFHIFRSRFLFEFHDLRRKKTDHLSFLFIQYLFAL